MTFLSFTGDSCIYYSFHYKKIGIEPNLHVIISTNLMPLKYAIISLKIIVDRRIKVNGIWRKTLISKNQFFVSLSIKN
ncbi:MAG: hypothetical protein D8M61_06020 [Ignavibacteriae bacterium]|nr:hypothetical protein [Ignavibacteriota bacterium]